MKKALTIAVAILGVSLSSKAQSSMGNPQNTEYAKKMDGTGGHFEYAISTRERVNVNYRLTPLHPVDNAKLFLHTPMAMPFSAKVMDQSGKEVASWKPAAENYFYDAEINTSKLKSGEYTVNIYMGEDSKSIYQIRFTKL